jgi:hypothetical protein
MKKFLVVVLMLVTLGLCAPIGFAQEGNNGHHYGQRYHRHHGRRTFWHRHRDKLTVAGTALGGAAIGGIAGGKKGAAIGAISGAAGGAVYTYGIRKRHQHHRQY